MILKLKMKTDLLSQTTPRVVMVPQNDGDCRELEIEFYAGQEPWEIPQDVIVRLYYGRGDGTGGSYEVLEDGSSFWTAEENRLTLTLVPQMFTQAGNLAAKVEFLQEEKRLNTFGFWIRVVHDCTEGAVDEQDYFNWSVWTTGELEKILLKLKESGQFDGPKGEKGDKGDPGEPGALEDLTKTHVETALGYAPAMTPIVSETNISAGSAAGDGRPYHVIE